MARSAAVIASYNASLVRAAAFRSHALTFDHIF